jgi:hypothetical protein
MSIKITAYSDKEALALHLAATQLELKNCKTSLRVARQKLALAKRKICNLKETVGYQRERILELYRNFEKLPA